MDSFNTVRIAASRSGMEAPDGSLDRPFASPKIRIPTLELVGREDEEVIAWDPREPLDSRTVCESTKGILERFLRLAGSGPQAVLRFAQRYGPLSLCDMHDLPLGHRPVPGQRELLCFPSGVEPVARYQAQASELGSLLLLASELRRGGIGNLSDWITAENAFRERHDRPLIEKEKAVDWFPLSTDQERKQLIRFYVHDWLSQASVEPKLEWTDRPSIELGGYGMFAELTRQVLFGIAGRNGWITCSECGRPFSPEKRRNPNRDSYCPQCGKKAADRNAQRRRRKRLRGEE